MRKIVVAALAVAAFAALGLTQAAIYRDSPIAGRWFLWLVVAHGVLAAALLLAAAAAAWKLAARRRRRVFGSSLSLNLAGWFALMAAAPALLLYGVAAQGIFRGIESWFDAPLGEHFEKGIDLSRRLLGREINRLDSIARNIAAAPSSIDSPFWLDDLRLAHQLESIVVYDSHGIALAASPGGGGAPSLRPQQLAAAALGREYRGADKDESGARRVVVVLPWGRAGGGNIVRVESILPRVVAEGLDALETGDREYRKLLALRRGLNLSFLIALTLAFATVLAAGFWAALIIGARLTRPLAKIALATQAVTGGDFSRRLSEKGYDELASLAGSFNRMTARLGVARATESQHRRDLAAANARLEVLLSRLTTGVLVFDRDGRLTRANDSAARILGFETEDKIPPQWPDGDPNQHDEDDPATAVAAALREGAPRESRLATKGKTMLMRSLPLPPPEGGHLVVIDDLTRQMQAEREATWEEASRRFAHEIKNPLTPIQLAAERMGKKLAGKLQSEDDETLRRGLFTIVKQAEAMGQMVDSFRRYAGRRALNRAAVDLNQLAREVADLYAGREAEVSFSPHPQPLPVWADAVLLRQVLHNLLANAEAAARAAADKRPPRVKISIARVDSKTARIAVLDSGDGVDEDIRARMFEPYATTKHGGTGLGLAEARRIVNQHQGQITVESLAPGALAVVSLPLADDASLPSSPSAEKQAPL